MKKPAFIPLTWSTVAFMIGMMFLSVGLLVVTDGNLIASLVPSIAVIAGAAVFTLPLRYTVFAFFSIALLFHNPASLPMCNKWRGPLYVLGPVLYENLNKMTGVGALKVNVVQLVTFTFLAVMALRTFMGNNIDGHQTSPAARPLKIGAFVALGATITWVVLGIAKGGNKSMIPLQMMLFAFSPLFAILFMRSFKYAQTIRWMGISIVAISVIRCMEGAYFFYTMAAPQGMNIEYIMTHNDTVLFNTAVMVLVINFLHAPSLKNGLYLFFFGSIIVWGIIYNDRRVAFVSLAMCMVFIYFYLAPAMRRHINRVLLYLLPVIAIYVLVGMKSQSAIFAPVHVFMSVSDESDASNISRDIENVNLMWTVRNNALLGTGFGFEYSELLPSVPLYYDFYKYLAHNQIIWLAFLGGFFGFMLIWNMLPIGTFLAYRGYIYAQTPLQRSTALMAVCTVIIYMVQAYADMGGTSYKASIVVYSTLAAAANLARQVDTDGVSKM